jgi:NAD-dependent SIR2 family protein deacetylase
MAKRKFTRIGETPTKFQCTNKKCKWEGTEDDKAKKKDDGWLVSVCPDCKNEEFYGIV